MNNIPNKICVNPNQYPNGCPEYIFYYGRNYRKSHMDENNNCCYVLMPMAIGGGKKKKKVVPCECTASISVTFTSFPHYFGDPFILDYTTSDCAISASITNLSNSDIINAPPPSGTITLSPGDNGYPSTAGANVYTITVITNSGSCISSVQVNLFFPPG